jgi:pyridoxine 5-phosphate synthase
MNQALLLGVNIDHIATVRQARGVSYPDPVQGALLAQEAGADGITLHLREDRRHIQDRDVQLLKEILQIPMNLEMAATVEMRDIAIKIKPEYVCIVPEKRSELTTEGGLNVVNQMQWMGDICRQLSESQISVSLFIDPDRQQIEAAKEVQAMAIEIHTGCYAEAKTPEQRQQELTRITEAALYAHQLGLIVNAGHGLHYHNVKPIAAIPVFRELNIGHAIIARACFSGLPEAIREMKRLMLGARLQPK